ncbi:MAG: hypothetical protein JWM85_3430 [Acidimicrobiaceae bacterium]|nr:hypothetical protein [Acidimicrobiaceae bacterium]
MRNLRRFEGTEPAEVRAQVLSELGPDAIMVRAGKERSGGLFGFFEREIFVIEAEPPDPKGASSPGADVATRFGEPSVPDGRETHEGGSETALRRLVEGTADVVSLVGRSGWAAPPEQAQDPSALPSSDALAVGFTSILEEAEAALAGKARSGADFREPLDASTEQVPARYTPAVSATPAPVPTGIIPGISPAADNAVSVARSRLSRLGLPAPLQPALDAPSLPYSLGPALALSLEALPPAPEVPALADAVVVTTGPRGAALELAKALACRLGLGDEALLVLGAGPAARQSSGGPRRYASALKLATAVAERRIAGRSSVVVVELPDDLSDLVQLHDAVAATRPEQVWASVPANTSVAQLARLAEHAGGLEALALADLDDAERPAELLTCDIPVAFLDGRPASALLWAARLLEERAPVRPATLGRPVSPVRARRTRPTPVTVSDRAVQDA